MRCATAVDILLLQCETAHVVGAALNEPLQPISGCTCRCLKAQNATTNSDKVHQVCYYDYAIVAMLLFLAVSGCLDLCCQLDPRLNIDLLTARSCSCLQGRQERLRSVTMVRGSHIGLVSSCKGRLIVSACCYGAALRRAAGDTVRAQQPAPIESFARCASAMTPAVHQLSI